MLTRRNFMQATGLLAGAMLTSCAGSSSPPTATASSTAPPTALADDWRMPDEAEPHARTWMAFGASQAIWGRRLLPEVRRNLALIARTIAKYEPVTLLVRPDEMAVAQSLLTDAPTAFPIDLLPLPLDDLWMRDTGPLFVLSAQGRKAGVDFNFNGWGNKQAHTQDAQVAGFVAKSADVPTLSTDLVLEGGCIEVDGHGTAIITESCVLNDNRNPGLSKADFEAKLKPLLGLEKIIWLPGIPGMDITDGHTDFYARFAGPGVVVAGYDPDPDSYDHGVTRTHLEMLRAATDAQGRALDVLVLEGPMSVRPTFENNDFAAGYVGFYVCNGAVIAQEFGDARADAAAKAVLQQAFPGRVIEQLNVDGIAAGGGSIHCTTQQEPQTATRSFLPHISG